MQWFDEYCDAAARTDQLTHRPNHVELLACGLFGEVGSLLTELKKERRESEAYPSYRNRVREEAGDLLWYLARLLKILAPRDYLNSTSPSALKVKGNDGVLAAAFSLGKSAGCVLETIHEQSRDNTVAHLQAIWERLQEIVNLLGLDLGEIAQENINKVLNRWPNEKTLTPFFDDNFSEEEQLPRKLLVEFRPTTIGEKELILLRCNGLNFGDRLTDNIDDPDFYRFHDVFHFAYVVFLGWSPVTRHLLRCKRKSNPSLDENEDGARARIVEEAVSAIVFSRAKEMHYYEGIEVVDYDLLKTIEEIVNGYEVERVALWQWETAILQGYRIFRQLRNVNGGKVRLDMVNRELAFEALSYRKPDSPAGGLAVRCQP